MNLRFPVFLIASDDGVVVVKTDGNECIMLFHTKELAQQQLKKIELSHPQFAPLDALEVTSPAGLTQGLKDLPPEVTCAVWDPMGQSAGVAHVSVDELIRIAGGQ